MLRWMTPFLVAIFAIGTAAADGPEANKTTDGPAAAKPADSPAAAQPAVKPASSPVAAKRAATRRATVHAASQLPPGLPRAHYKYRTTVAPAAAPLYVRRGRALVVEEEVDMRFSPVNVAPYAPRLFNTPLLPGSSTLPGYYGTSHSYSYDGPYYGGPYTPYWDRLPYACGVFGYC
jgi:hypothetical protein